MDKASNEKVTVTVKIDKNVLGRARSKKKVQQAFWCPKCKTVLKPSQLPFDDTLACPQCEPWCFEP